MKRIASVRWIGIALLLIPFIPSPRVSAQTAPAAPAGPPSSAKPAASPGSYRTLHAIRVQSTLVVAPVTVIDRSGNFIENLPQNDFRVMDDGVPQQITRFGLAMEPVAAVIVIQTNNSVAPVLAAVHPLGSMFSGMLLGPQGEAAVLTYSDKVNVAQNFSNDSGKLATTLRHVEVNGGKARLNDALARAVLMLANRNRSERRIIIVFSDGFDHGSETSREEILQAAADSNIAIYGLRFDPTQISLKDAEASGADSQSEGADPLPLIKMAVDAGSNRVHRNLVSWYARYTGGMVYTHWKSHALEDQLQRIALEINSQYVLAYVPSTLKQKGFHRIQVQVVSPPGLRVRTRAGYFYGTQ